jgi:hypothetical protein
LHARIEHKAGLFALVEVQRFERFDHPTDRHLFAQVTGDPRCVLADAVAVCGYGGLSPSRWVRRSGIRCLSAVNRTVASKLRLALGSPSSCNHAGRPFARRSPAHACTRDGTRGVRPCDDPVEPVGWVRLRKRASTCFVLPSADTLRTCN